MPVRLIFALSLAFSASAHAFDAELNFSQFLNEIRAKDRLTKMSVNEALASRQQYPQQEEVVIRSMEEAEAICDAHFEGVFFWRNCAQDLNQTVIPKKVLLLAAEISKTSHYEVTLPLLLTAGAGYIDAEAFITLSFSVIVPNLDALAAIMVNAQFDPELMSLCTSNAVDEARRLNQNNTFKCIVAIRNKQVTATNQAGIQACKSAKDEVSRTTCVEAALSSTPLR